jgi:biotin carboxylase
MTGATTPGGAPRLAYVVHPGSFATLALFEASRGLCELLWIVDAAAFDATELRLLRRTGAVLDVGGLAVDRAAEQLAALSPAGILSLADDKLRWTASVAELLGLPFHSPATAASLTDKLAQRQCLRDAGLPAPRSWVVTGPDGLDGMAPQLTFPAVLKPRLGEGSRDTVSVLSFVELEAVVAEIWSDAAGRRELVIEEYIADAGHPLAGEGFAGYVSVESYVARGLITHLAVTGRFPPAFPFRETGFFIPSAVDPPLVDDVKVAAASAAVAIGVTTGCLHTEVKLTDAGPVVIEVNGRIGGGVPEMLHAAAGINFLSLAMRLALGLDAAAPTPVAFERLAYLFYVHAPAKLRTVTSVEGLEAVRAYPGVDEVILRRGPGSQVDWHEGNHGHVASVFGTATGHHELRQVHAFVAETIRIHGA